MLSFAPTPIHHEHWDHRPVVSSPLSSSPIRASSPLSPIETNTLSQRQVQSSPIQQPKFKYASRPIRRNPVVRRREDAQEMRRKNFLQSVRQKSEDKAWLRRDVEGQLLKASFLARLELSAEGAPDISEADIDDAVAFQQQQAGGPYYSDNMMVDAAVDEEAELEAMLASYENQPVETEYAPSEMSDEDYDQLFAEFVAHEEQLQLQQQQQQQQYNQQSINHDDVMDEDDQMIF